MRPADVLRRLIAAGVTLEVDGDRLLARPAAALTDSHRELIRQHKPALLKVLSEPRRSWSVIEPNGDAWTSTFAPPVTMAELLAAYPSGTRAVPIADPDQGAELPEDIAELVNTYLDRIGEDDPQTRSEALQLARTRPSVRDLYRSMGKPGTPQKPSESDQGGAA
jgi:hypothetical protein